MEVKIKSQNKINDKQCKICKETKSVTEFSIKDGASDGFESACKPCESERNKQKYRAIRAKRIKKNNDV